MVHSGPVPVSPLVRSMRQGRLPLYDGPIAGRSVLVVEDDYFLADAMSRMLQAGGAEVVGPVPSVAAALRLLRTRRPDAAVLDVNIGQETVFPVADALAADGVPFLFVTAADKVARPERHDMAPWLSKPAEASTTVRELVRILDAA